jgi:tetratricopeptide (TPR) repeat protein
MKTHYLLYASQLAAILALLVTLAVPTPLQAQDSAERQFGAISRLIEKADLTRETGNPQASAQLYGATLAAYREFSERFPDYQTELVQFRESYCRQQLMDLLAQKKAKERTLAAATLPPEIRKALQQGVDLCREGRFADAHAALLSLPDNAADTVPITLVLATAKLGMGDLDGARQALQRVLERDAENGIAHYNLVQLMLREPAPDYDASREHYRQARRLGIPADSDLESVLDL